MVAPNGTRIRGASDPRPASVCLMESSGFHQVLSLPWASLPFRGSDLRTYHELPHLEASMVKEEILESVLSKQDRGANSQRYLRPTAREDALPGDLLCPRGKGAWG